MNVYSEATARCFVKKSVLQNFPKFTGKHLCLSFFFNKVAGLKASNFIKKRLQHNCFHKNVENVNIFKNTYFEEHLRATASIYSL